MTQTLRNGNSFVDKLNDTTRNVAYEFAISLLYKTVPLINAKFTIS